MSYLKAISVEDTYVFHPLKFLTGLKEILKEKQIYENTKVVKIIKEKQNYLCFTENGVITAKNVVITCHYPFFNLPFLLPLKSYIEKSYIIAKKVAQNEHYSCINLSNPLVSVRFYEDGKNKYQICLAKSHNTAVKQNDLENFIEVGRLFHIKKEEMVAFWSNVDIITDDSLPYIGELKNNLFIATGFNTWGMTNGILAGKILAERIEGKVNKYETLFSVHRKNSAKVKSFFSNTAVTLYNFIKSQKKKKNWYTERLTFTKENGRIVATFLDENGVSHKVIPTCPHLGCGLVFNEAEKTWDCPCHSSRFTMDGKCLKGPSLYDISYKEDEK